MGVPDEYGVLNEGEIFCQWQDPEDRLDNPQVVQGPVVVCRAPAMHMGDIRRVIAVDHPRLRHLVNVIVFNVKGSRDLPNMLGGGDLDGDDYTLIWDKRFLIKENSPPMDYTPPEPVRVRQVTTVHIRENFVNYLKNDMLGQIANAHLAWTDIEDPSAYECTELARLHSVAVDFAKTGVPADMPDDLRPKRWPDFMDKAPKYTYRSEKILGQLFRIVDPEPTFKETRQEDITKSLDRTLCDVSVPSELLELVAQTKVAYDVEIWCLLLRYRLAEAEAFCGIVLRNDKRHKPKDHDLKEPVTQAFSLIEEEARQEIMNEYAVLYDPDSTFDVPGVGKKLSFRNMIAIACYQVAYLEKYRHLTDDAADDLYDDAAESLSPIGCHAL
ncbi:hypothetical protein QFC22_004243 [Naganishia vaughanmartiniae]|uniref:Uncharacterized protein n=1 Tax=Naganishia vaughanmartiniae TaxID=1424756 RepID=A0ACC2X2Q6_9TREE|nr:hypothetical protein QFC22_004243 [Naganishia vaughanmartiniae]